jgi:hypothetical protein
MTFFPLTPEELARVKYGNSASVPAKAKAEPPKRLKEIIRKGPFALVWVNPNPPSTDDEEENDDNECA